MQAQNSNINFGMAFRSPSRSAMPYFKKYLANGTDRIDTSALGEFVVKQSKNEKVDLQYLHTKNGDMFEVFEVDNPKNKVIVPIKNAILNEVKPKGFLDNLKDWFKIRTASYEYLPLGSMENLPSELKQAGKIADSMEKKLA